MLDRLVVFGGRIADGNWTVAAVATPGPPKMQIVILNVHRPCRRQGSLDAEPDDATEATIVEMGFFLRQAAAFKVVDDVASIVLPGYARLEIGKRMPECSKGVTDATGPGGKETRTCLAVCAHDEARRGKACICALGDSAADIELDAEHPAVILPVVADLTTCKERRGIDDAAIN
ncbi:hypothetical protein J2R78_001375 [Bradyrhizobium sp. USDA 4538]|nr:hypothetical protein [Bradyrhizobium sp. USDA 4538]MCP1898972.1 hypothetical protein [Bradyrhizobium sp. USDA 4537]MCP1986914.1 hypothetical protein [Bradyrhizobium sp. USDA 4539]